MKDELRDVIDQIRSRINIADVISGYIPIKKSGGNFKAACPFHHEKTPSFMISPSKQIYHCFGCGAGGDAINFIMEYEKISFFDALKILADKAGVKLPSMRSDAYSANNLKSNAIYKANEAACSYYSAILLGSKKAASARQYLKNRGINAKTVADFKIGFAPEGWDMFLKYAEKNNIGPDVLKKAGLVIEGAKGLYDRFRNRIIFPIFDASSKVIAFGARAIDKDAEPKYMNSPETAVYVKGRNLYGINIASRYIREKDEAIFVEGYLDQITPYQNGIKNIVATLGTALTTEQARLIKRFSSNVVIIYDADEAGQAAALRGLDVLVAENLNVKVATLPKGYDPDSFVVKNEKDAFDSIIAQSKGLFDYKLDILISKNGIDTSEAKAKIISEMLPTIKRVTNAVLKSEYVKKLSEILSISKESILTELEKIVIDYSSKTELQDKKIYNIKNEAKSSEKKIAALLFEGKEMAKRIKASVDINELSDERIIQIVKQSFLMMEKGQEPDPSKLIHFFDDKSMSSFICAILTEAEGIIDKEKTLNDCLVRIKKDSLKCKRDEIANKIKIAERSGNDDEVTELLKQFNNLRSKTING